MNSQLEAIVNSKIPARRVLNLRSQPRKEWAKAVRKLFKEMGLTGLSVTTPNHSMASSINIRLPDIENCTYEQLTAEQRFQPHNELCPAHRLEWEAHRKIDEIMKEVFVDLDDRSDTMIDYFDFCYTVNC